MKLKKNESRKLFCQYLHNFDLYNLKLYRIEECCAYFRVKGHPPMSGGTVGVKLADPTVDI